MKYEINTDFETKVRVVTAAFNNARQQDPFVSEMTAEMIQAHARYIAQQAWHVFCELDGNLNAMLAHVHGQRGITIYNKSSYREYDVEDWNEFLANCQPLDPMSWSKLGFAKGCLEYIFAEHYNIWRIDKYALYQKLTDYLNGEIELPEFLTTPASRLNALVAMLES